MQDEQTKEHRILDKCDYFIEVGLWPRREVIRPSTWLTNFREDEKRYALHLLDMFLYIPNWMVKELLVSTFQNLSMPDNFDGLTSNRIYDKWRNFVSSCIITYVTGEPPNPSDSGLAFARQARLYLGIDGKNIKTPKDTLLELQYHAKPVIFFDDFVGSGNQFVSTWNRTYQLSDALITSFSDMAAKLKSPFFYCPVVCTEIGLNSLRSQCLGLQVQPGNILSSRYSALEEEFWPKDLWPSAMEFLEKTSLRAGYSRYKWKGYANLGLTISFEDAPPNATLPIFYSDKKQWKPLIHKN